VGSPRVWPFIISLLFCYYLLFYHYYLLLFCYLLFDYYYLFWRYYYLIIYSNKKAGDLSSPACALVIQDWSKSGV